MLRYTWLSIGLTLSLALVLALGSPYTVQAMGGCGGGDHSAMMGSGHMGSGSGNPGYPVNPGPGYQGQSGHMMTMPGGMHGQTAPGTWVPGYNAPAGQTPATQGPSGQSDHSGHQH
ncbi:MAG: hypothetical protein FJ134_07270 [Deltaproteobacteria bacterium]|nr:hypothetical protein [Deltaproteobacteria bacterium]